MPAFIDELDNMAMHCSVSIVLMSNFKGVLRLCTLYLVICAFLMHKHSLFLTSNKENKHSLHVGAL